MPDATLAPVAALNTATAEFTAACSYIKTHSPSEGRCSRCGARCRVARHEVMTPAGLAMLGDRCAEIVLGGFRPWESKSNGKGGVSAPEEDDDDTLTVAFPEYGPKPGTIAARFGGTCSCGRSFAAGAEIVYAGGVEGCEGCDFGRGAALPVGDDFLIQIDAMRAELDVAIYNSKRWGPYSRGKALRKRHDAALAHWIRLPSERQKELVEARDAAKAAKLAKASK
jgi:hypothetical protein